MIKYIWLKKYNNTKIRLIMTTCSSCLTNNNQPDSSDSTKINIKNINQKIKTKINIEKVQLLKLVTICRVCRK